MMDAILNFDMAIFRWVESSLWSPLLDQVMVFITRLGDAGWVWILLALGLCLFPKTRQAGFAMAIALLLSLIVGDGVLKSLFGRQRPFDLPQWQGIFQYPELIPKPQSFSFPSGHTGSSVGAAVALLLTQKKGWTAAALVLALLIGFSRIYLHVHYPTDVLAGCLAGVLYGAAGWWLSKTILPKIRRWKSGVNHIKK